MFVRASVVALAAPVASATPVHGQAELLQPATSRTGTCSFCLSVLRTRGDVNLQQLDLQSIAQTMGGCWFRIRA